MPEITIKAGFVGPDGREETLVEYICDHPGCPNPATRLLGVGWNSVRASWFATSIFRSVDRT